MPVASWIETKAAAERGALGEEKAEFGIELVPLQLYWSQQRLWAEWSGWLVAGRWHWCFAW